MPKYRFELTKDEPIRYISHLDYASLLERAICRAKLPVIYSEGFNPHMKMSFATALAVGVTSASEYMDLELQEEIPLEILKQSLQKVLPNGVRLLRLRHIKGKTKALMSLVDEAVYDIKCPLKAEMSVLEVSLLRFNREKEVFFLRITPKKKREIEIKQYLVENITARLEDTFTVSIFMTIRISSTGSIKPLEVLEVLVKKYDLPVDFVAAKINRQKLFSKGRDLLQVID